MSNQPFVSIDQVTRIFDGFKAVENVSFTFEKGDIFGFIGPNGSGKTTTMRILSTLDIATAGDCYVEGVSVTDYPEIMHQRIGFMPDYYEVPVNVTIEEYLDYFARNYGQKGKKRRDSVQRIIEFMDMSSIRYKSVSSLSKGMKQRLCLGRTLINDPDVLILDEPAAGLDPRARIEFRELLKILAKQGKAILISSHILTELSEICDSCAIIERGQVLSAGKIDQIQENMQQGAAIQVVVMFESLVEDALVKISQLPFVGNIDEVTIGKKYQFEIPDKKVICDTLKRLVEMDLPVIEFYLKDQNLESLFLGVTKGQIQ